MENIITGLDIGTTKICAIIGRLNEFGKLEIIGVGTAPSRGLKKGIVVNIERTMHSITKAIEEAELMAGVEVESVYTGIAGAHINSLTNRGIVAISRPSREIKQSDVERVIESAKAIALPPDQEIIHVIPQEFIVDDQDGVKDPVGMSGLRLEAIVHIITGSITSIENIIKSVHRAGYEVDDIVLQPLASAESVLTEEEKELGVVLVDMGGGTTDVIIFIKGSVWHTGVIPLGGEYITSDIAIGLRTPQKNAEEIKKRWGCTYVPLVKDNEQVEVPGLGGRGIRKVPRKFLAEIIQPRMEEILTLVIREIKKSGVEDLIPAGVVLTGGTSLLEGTSELAEKLLGVPVRIGYPQKVEGLTDRISNPMYSTGVGLVMYGSKHQSEKELFHIKEKGLFANIFKKLTNWFKENF